MSNNQPKPFSKKRTKIIVGRIIYFYSIFYVLIRIFSGFQNDTFLPHFLIAIPFIALASIGFTFEKNKNYSWIYVIIGVVLISVIRFYEQELFTYFLKLF